MFTWTLVAAVSCARPLPDVSDAVGYVKASNAGAGDEFGQSIALSADGNTLAIGARYEGSAATMIDGDQANDAAPDAGAVYVFVREATGEWVQQAYIKPSRISAGDSFGTSVALSGDGTTLAVGAASGEVDGNTTGVAHVFVRDPMGTWVQQAQIESSNANFTDVFGYRLALSGDGNTLAVSALWEDSSATGIDGDGALNDASNSGAVYVFVRNEDADWSQQAYVKASNTAEGDIFGASVALSEDGDVMAVGAPQEDGSSTGVDGDQADDSAPNAGAVYVFTRDVDAWSQQAYIKASNASAGDELGRAVALSADGNTLAMGARTEDGSATGIDGDQADDATTDSGAVYVLVHDSGQWAQQAYVKASNTGFVDRFGVGLALSGDGNMLAVGAEWEDSRSTGIDGDQTNDAATDSGAVYVLVRDDAGEWSHRSYVKAPNPGAGDLFGWSLALSDEGDTLAVGAYHEDSHATGIGGEQSANTAEDAGAVYLY